MAMNYHILFVSSLIIDDLCLRFTKTFKPARCDLCQEYFYLQVKTEEKNNKFIRIFTNFYLQVTAENNNKLIHKNIYKLLLASNNNHHQ